MPKRKVDQTIILHRDGQRVKPVIGTIFDFSADELAQIERTNPDAISRPIIAVDVENEEARKEADGDGDAEAKAAAKAAAKAKADAKKNTGGKATDDEV